MIIICSCKHIHLCLTSNLIWYLIINPYGIIECKIPQRKIINPKPTPMKQSMNHKGERHVHYCLDSALSLVSLMLYADSRIFLRFNFLLTITPESISSEDYIITSLVFFYLETFYHIHDSKLTFPITVSPAPR